MMDRIPIGYDVLGDIHVQRAKLIEVLQRLGYREQGVAFRHSGSRQAIFVGDLIDRGPMQEALLAAVRIGADSPVPVFIGHYCLNGARQIQHPSIAVLDHGSAIHGPPGAYRWCGEPELDSRNLVVGTAAA